MGVVVVRVARASIHDGYPHPARLRFAPAADPPHKGEGKESRVNYLERIKRYRLENPAKRDQ